MGHVLFLVTYLLIFLGRFMAAVVTVMEVGELVEGLFPYRPGRDPSLLGACAAFAGIWTLFLGSWTLYLFVGMTTLWLATDPHFRHGLLGF